MKFETSKTLFNYGYSNGSISLYDLMFDNPLIDCNNEKSYQELLQILLFGTWAEQSSISGYSINKIIQDYQDDYLLRRQDIKDRNDLTKQHSSLYNRAQFTLNSFKNRIFYEYSYLDTLLDKLGATRKLYWNKSLNPANIEKMDSKEEILIEPSIFYVANNIDLESALENIESLNTSYQRLVIRNLVDYSEKNSFKVWKTRSNDVPHEDTLFVSIQSTSGYKVLVVLPILDTEELGVYKVRMSNYLKEKNKIKKNYIGVIVPPFGRSETVGDLTVVPLSCLKE